jgi:hypothetical protein
MSANILITFCVCALACGAFIAIRSELSELQNPSAERLTTKFFAACVLRQKFSPSTKEMGITLHQIETYCRCYAESLLGLATIEERRYFAQNETAPLGFESKVLKAADNCFPVIEQTN